MKEIVGWNLKKQKFHRTEIPEIFNEIEFSSDGSPIFDDEHIPFIQQELERIKEGYWFMNNGIATYITGLHYFYLNYWTLEDGTIPDYRDCDRRYFYFQDYCEKDPNIFGIIRTKKRREGATSQATADLVKTAITTVKARCGIVSKTGKDAAKAFSDMIKPGFKSMPVFLKPVLEDDTAKTELVFTPPKNKKKFVDRKKGQLYDDSVGIGSRIDFMNTVMNAYDSGRLTKIMIDECLAPDTKIMVADGTFKEIKELNVGDFVTIEGGEKRRIDKIFTGQDDMFLVKQKYGKDYIVNSKHRLFVRTSWNKNCLNEYKTITPLEYLNLSKYQKRTTWRVISNGINFNKTETFIPAYLFGLWIGDGCKGTSSIVINKTDDIEIYEYLKQFCIENDYEYREKKCLSPNKDVICFYIKREKSESAINGRASCNKIIKHLKDIGVLNEKRIPDCYKYTDTDSRLSLLAGVIDTDGYYNKNGGYEITFNNRELLEDISYIASSCGFSVKNIREKKTNFGTLSYNISISGDLHKIPCLVKRKIVKEKNEYYNNRRCKIDIVPLGIGDYVGVQLESNTDDQRKLILEDFTLTMNCGKFPTEVPINEYWPIVKQTLRQGGIKVGFALMPSTSNKLEKGGRGYKVLWDDSNQFDKKETGSGLYRYFNDAADGYIPYIDEYGMSIWNKPTKEQAAWMKFKYSATDLQCSMSVVDWLKYEHDLIKDEAGRNEFKRMFPRTEKDAFDFADNSNIYDMNKVFDQKDYLLSSDIKLRKVRFYRTHEGKVDFVDDENGFWSILILPEESEKNQTVEIGGRIRPAQRSKYFISIDPYKNTLLVGKGSKAGAFVWAKSNPLDPENTGFPIAMYHGRPKLKSIFHNDMLMAAEFYSCECCYESDYDEFIEHFQREKKLHFTMDRPKNSIDPNRKSRASDAYKGVKSADGFSYSMMIDRSVEFVLQRCNKIYFMELLNELEEYDVKERTNYDLAVAFQVGCLVMADPIKKTTPILKVSSMIETFDLTKSRS